MSSQDNAHPLRRSHANLAPLRAHRAGGEPYHVIAEILGDNLSWVTDEALCRQTDPALFWPATGDSAKDAHLICERCPLVDPCRAYSLTQQEFGGVWGATSSTERRRLRKGRAA